MATGEILSTASVTEPTGGSDPSGGRTVYTREGDDFIINGRKCFITNSHIANAFVLLAKSDEEGSREFTAFMVEKGMEGYRPTRVEHKVGMRGCNTGEQVFENLRIPHGKRIGWCGQRNESGHERRLATLAGAVWSVAPWVYRQPAWRHPSSSRTSGYCMASPSWCCREFKTRSPR